MSFFEFPHTRTYDKDLGWLIKTVIEMSDTLKNFVSLNTIKYADPIQWNITTQYEPNTVVIDPLTGIAYISTQPVPSGVDLSNTDYWTVVFDLSSLIDTINNNLTVHDAGTSSTATFNSAVGDWLLLNGVLYVVTSPIAIGNAYVVGGNIVQQSVEQLIATYVNGLNGNIQTIADRIGALTDLNTTDKTSIVNAINEVDGNIDSVDSKIGLLSGLNTTDKTSIVNAINTLTGSKVLTVGSSGAQYTTINDAITAASQYCTDSDRVCILIYEGTYNENIKLFPNPGIDLVGLGKVTVQSATGYPDSPLYIGGNSYVEGIDFLSSSPSGSETYGLHLEAAATDCELKFVNCQFTSVNAAGAGIGMANNLTATFINCKFVSWSTISLYAHNYPGPGNSINQALNLYGCEFFNGGNASDAVIEDARYRMGYENTYTSYMSVSFAHCIFFKGEVKYQEVDSGGTPIVNQSYFTPGKNVTLAANSRNTLYSVDVDKCFPKIHCTGYCDAIGSVYLPCENANKYTWTITNILNQNGGDITSDGVYVSSDSGGIRLRTPNNVSQNCVYTIDGVPA